MGSPLMTLIFSESPVSLIQLMSDTMENTKNGSEAASDEKFDTLELRNRTVTETLSPVEDLGQDKKEKAEDSTDKFDKLELRNRTVTETLSLVEDFGTEAKPDDKTEKNQEDDEEPKKEEEKFDKLELRNRTVTETMSLV